MKITAGEPVHYWPACEISCKTVAATVTPRVSVDMTGSEISIQCSHKPTETYKHTLNSDTT